MNAAERARMRLPMRLTVAAQALSGPSFAAEDPSDMLITIEAEDVAPSAREAASESQAAIDSTGPARRTTPGGVPITRLNARANAASER